MTTTLRQAVATAINRDREGALILTSTTLGHAAIHWFQQIYPVVIPSIKASFGLSDVQVGALSSVKQFTTGPFMLPAGILADFFRNGTALILAASFLSIGIAHLVVAYSPSYLWLLVTVGTLGIGTALWHPAAAAALSRRFPVNRGAALAAHGVGASVGDTIAPIAIGALLGVFTWQGLLQWHMIPALVIAVLLWKGLTPVYERERGVKPSVGSYWEDMKAFTKHPVVLGITGVNTLTAIGRVSVITFLPIYIKEDLGYSNFVLGVYIALLYAMGALSQPAMGHLSDRFGRKAVLLPSLVVFGLLYLALAAADGGVQLSLVIGALGLFFYGLATVTQAAVMDVASDRVQASTMGMTSIAGQLLTLPGPIIAGVLIGGFGTKSSFVFAGVTTLLSALLLMAVRIPRTAKPAPKVAG